jgi:hypothetical protein
LGGETGRLFHEHRLVFGENTVEESGFDVELPEIPIEGGGDVDNGTERFETYRGGGGFVVIDTVSLREAFCYVADLVSYDFSCVVALAFAN